MRIPTDRKSGTAVIAIAVAGIAVATLTPSTQDVVYSGVCLVCGELGGVDIVLNLALFVPLGVGLALAGVRPRSAVVVAFALTLLVEVLQLTVVTGRDSSLGDVAANTAGGLTGYVVARSFAWWFRPPAARARALLAGWLVAVGTLQALASAALGSSLPPSTYYGQLAPALGGRPPYAGAIHSATLGGVPVPGTAFDDSERVRALLAPEGDGVLDASFAAASLPEGPLTAVIRVADAEQREILVLGMDDGAVVFGTRSRGMEMRLRPLRIAIPRVGPGAADAWTTIGDTILVSARQDRREVRLRVSGGSREGEVRHRLSPIAIWRLLTPWQTYEQGTWLGRLCDLAWAGSWFVLAGLWLRRSRRRDEAASLPRGPRFGGGALCCLGVLVALVVPFAFGLRPPITPMLVAALAGLAAGWGVAGLRPPTGTP